MPCYLNRIRSFMKGQFMKTWFYKADSEEAGPLTTKELQRLASTGVILSTTLVRRCDMKRWVQASRIQGLLSPDQANGAIHDVHRSDTTVPEDWNAPVISTWKEDDPPNVVVSNGIAVKALCGIAWLVFCLTLVFLIRSDTDTVESHEAAPAGSTPTVASPAVVPPRPQEVVSSQIKKRPQSTENTSTSTSATSSASVESQLITQASRETGFSEPAIREAMQAASLSRARPNNPHDAIILALALLQDDKRRSSRTSSNSDLPRSTRSMVLDELDARKASLERRAQDWSRQFRSGERSASFVQEGEAIERERQQLLREYEMQIR
jgi:hypothetical protein